MIFVAFLVVDQTWASVFALHAERYQYDVNSVVLPKKFKSKLEIKLGSPSYGNVEGAANS